MAVNKAGAFKKVRANEIATKTRLALEEAILTLPTPLERIKAAKELLEAVKIDGEKGDFEVLKNIILKNASQIDVSVPEQYITLQSALSQVSATSTSDENMRTRVLDMKTQVTHSAVETINSLPSAAKQIEAAASLLSKGQIYSGEEYKNLVDVFLTAAEQVNFGQILDQRTYLSTLGRISKDKRHLPPQTYRKAASLFANNFSSLITAVNTDPSLERSRLLNNELGSVGELLEQTSRANYHDLAVQVIPSARKIDFSKVPDTFTRYFVLLRNCADNSESGWAKEAANDLKDAIPAYIETLKNLAPKINVEAAGNLYKELIAREANAKYITDAQRNDLESNILKTANELNISQLRHPDEYFSNSYCNY